MSPEDVTDLLDYGLMITLGQEHGTPRLHRLFFSPEDRQWFVAIQDELTKELITILPLDYYENLWEKVARPALVAAQRLVSQGIKEKTQSVVPSQYSGPFFYVTVAIRQANRRVRQLHLGPWPSHPFQQSVTQFMDHPLVQDQIRNGIACHVNATEVVSSIRVQLGKKGRPLDVRTDTLRVPEGNGQPDGPSCAPAVW